MSYLVTRTITIDATKCGTADSTDYPLLVSETLAGLKTQANGGDVVSASGYDIAFFSNPGLTTQLAHEVEYWSGTTGQLIAWVKIPTLSHTSNTVIYLAYSNSAIVSSQENITGTWNSGFGAVYHFGVGAAAYSTPVRKDSTANANTLGNGSSFTTQGTGQVGDALNTSNSAQPLIAADHASIKSGSAFMIEAWLKPSNFSDFRVAIVKGDSGNRNYSLYTTITTGTPSFVATQGAGVYRSVIGASALSTSVFSHVVGTFDGSFMRLYVNGVSVGTPLSITGSLDTPAMQLWIGEMGVAVNVFVGLIDEVRFSNSARSTSWITSTYNNISSPSTFYTLGAAGAVAPISTTQIFVVSML